jgi:hypothetical protein
MSTSDDGVPSALRDRVFADLRPVRPLADPWKRALVLAPLGLALLGLVHLRYGTRGDLGGLLLWGLSLLQIAVGVGLVVAALREVIPDRALSIPVQIVLFAAGFALALGVTYLAWHASGTVAPPQMRYPYWKGCFRGTIEVGLPALLLILLLAARGMMWRPSLVGGLAGLAAGLIADAAWRTFCNVAEPTHVLSAHFAGIVALVVIGAFAAKLYAWLARVG